MLFTTAACNFSTSEQTKVLRRLPFFHILTFKCAFRHSGVQFFDIWTDKSAPKPSCFVHFDFQMCFSPQRCAIFRHLNFKKCSEHVSFLTFSLQNLLFATAACNFSTSELQKVVQTCGVLYIFTSKCAFRHSGVQFLMSPLSTYLRTRRFNRPTFGLTRHTNLWKNTAFRDFSNIWRGCIFFLLTFWLLHLLSTDLTTLLLLFNSPYCQKFLFKLPSIMWPLWRNNRSKTRIMLVGKWSQLISLVWNESDPSSYQMYLSGQIRTFHQPRFPWNSRDFPSKRLHFEVKKRARLVCWPDIHITSKIKCFKWYSPRRAT